MFGVGAVFDLLRRAGFAGDRVILHRRTGRRSIGRHHGLERLDHQFIRDIADDLPHALGRVLLHHVPVAVFEAVHQHRPHEHLQPRHRDALSHRDLRDGHLAPVFDRIQNSPDFTWQRDARALAETKIPHVIVKPVFPEADADFRGADV